MSKVVDRTLALVLFAILVGIVAHALSLALGGVLAAGLDPIHQLCSTSSARKGRRHMSQKHAKTHLKHRQRILNFTSLCSIGGAGVGG